MKAMETEQISLQRGNFKLESISSSFPKGQITTIIGPNGSGKSTLLNIITRLQPSDTGNVSINGKASKQYKTKEFAKTVTMLPQSKDLLLHLTVKELVSYGRSPYQKKFARNVSSDDEAIINWAMEVTSTKPHADQMYHTLSGGEQQKARIAMALAQKTDILLLDEPTTFLDIAHQFDVLEILQQINKQYNITIVMVLHDLQQAVFFSNYLIAMKSGKIVTTGSPESVLTSSFLKEVYEIDAKIKYEDDYPIIIPVTNKKKSVHAPQQNRIEKYV
ncbi:ABC transporter ATP-binding protein [Salipaludibacillus sp. HK11]|uniref:ABC transporter ATP-binding protein n=1 Tax=Salipaludibacillus sp. HK11 TaxID=3394320 RepID=UPI0039FC4D41